MTSAASFNGIIANTSGVVDSSHRMFQEKSEAVSQRECESSREGKSAQKARDRNQW
jgi:hypothetical protein